MSRRPTLSKTINGKKYYTANYFIEKTFVGSRTARKVLSSYESIEGHKNPKLYEKSTIDRAIYKYLNVDNEEELEEEEERRRAGKEEDEDRKQVNEYLKDPDAYEKHQNEENIERELAINAHKKYKRDINNMLLRSLLQVSGYVFDDEKYKKDLEIDEFSENFRQIGEERTKEHREAKKRLKSAKSYLIRIK